MNPPKRLRAAKTGQDKSVRLDEAGLVRLAYCERVANEHLRIKASFSTIVRRSLVLYEAHCQALVRGDIGAPNEADLYRQIEAAQLRIVNKGSASPDVTVEAVRGSPVLRTVGELAKEVRSGRPTLHDQLKRDLEKWRKTDEH